MYILSAINLEAPSIIWTPQIQVPLQYRYPLATKWKYMPAKSNMARECLEINILNVSNPLPFSLYKRLPAIMKSRKFVLWVAQCFHLRPSKALNAFKRLSHAQTPPTLTSLVLFEQFLGLSSEFWEAIRIVPCDLEK